MRVLSSSRTGIGTLKNKKPPTIGVISDTHGLLRPEAIQALEGSTLIFHAGDIGKPEVISTLEELAPVIAVRGNNDRGGWARKFPRSTVVRVGKVKIYILHDLKGARPDPAARGYRAVICGHSHHPSITEQNGVLFVNPGSAGPRRFKLPVSVARLEIEGDALRAAIVPLAV